MTKRTVSYVCAARLLLLFFSAFTLTQAITLHDALSADPKNPALPAPMLEFEQEQNRVKERISEKLSLTGEKTTYWTLQLGSFRRLSEARTFEENLSLEGARIEKIGEWYSIRAGLAKERQDLEALKKVLREKGFVNHVTRKCYSIPERVVYSRQESYEEIRVPSKPPYSENIDETIQRAVMLARKGQTEQALSMLETMREQRPEDTKLLRDYAVILGWAGRDHEAFSLAEKMSVETAPLYVINALAKSARNIRLFDESVSLYEKALARMPDNLQSKTGLALALSDAGRPDDALTKLSSWLKQDRRNLDLLLARAYAYETKKQRLEALRTYEEILNIDPNQKHAQRRKILNLSALGAPGLALSMAHQSPKLLDEKEMAILQSDYGAMEIKWGKIPAPAAEERFNETDDGLFRLDQAIQKLTADQGMEETSPPVLRARFDRITALHDRYRMEEVVSEYETLIHQDVPLPLYVLTDAADAYLYLEDPRKAAALYTKALEKNPDDFNLHLSLFWATMELGDFDRAIGIMDELAAREPAWRTRLEPGAPAVYSRNPKRLTADRTGAMGRAFADDLQGAQERLETLLRTAPYNHDLRQSLAYVSLWRGWPRKALGEFDKILPVDPEFLDARLGRAHALMDLREYDAAEGEVKDLYGVYPEQKRVQRLKREWDLYKKRIFRMEAGFGGASATDQDSDSFRIDTHLYSRPIHDHYRAYLHSFYEKGDLQNLGTTTYQREGLGLLYEGRDLTGYTEVHQNKGSDQNADFSAGLNWEACDHWSFGASFDSFSLDAPFRARLNDITAWSAGLSAAYRAHESAGARLSLQRLDFTDDNIRSSAFLALDWRVHNRPYFKIPVTLELYGSQNSKKDRPYFNPEKDMSVTGTVDFRWLVWRWYTRSFAHNLAFTGGVYGQKGFRTKPISAVRYEHDWNFSDALSLLYGITWSRRVYDGDSENGTWTFLTLNWRF